MKRALKNPTREKVVQDKHIKEEQKLQKGCGQLAERLI